MDFLVELFRNLVAHKDWSMPQACADSYQKTLKKWHGWLASSTFSVCTHSHLLSFISIITNLILMSWDTVNIFSLSDGFKASSRQE